MKYFCFCTSGDHALLGSLLRRWLFVAFLGDFFAAGFLAACLAGVFFAAAAGFFAAFLAGLFFGLAAAFFLGEAAFLTAGFFAAGFLAAFLGDFLAFGLAAAFSPSLNDPLAPVDFPTFDRTPFSVPFLSAILRREFTGFWSLPSL